jgi:trehalose/maltose hydrolase-like predicted phosphorylase
MNDAGFPIEDPAWAQPAPGWHMHADGLEPAREADIESRFTTANGLLAMRGARDLGRAAFWTSWITTFRPISWPRCYVAGLFDVPDIEPPIPVAMPAPDWLRLRLSVNGTLVRLRQGADLSRTLDLRRGLLLSEWRHECADGTMLHLRTLRLAARHAPSLALQVVQIVASRGGLALALDALPDPAGTGLGLARLEPGLSVWRAEQAPHSVALATRASLRRGDTELVPETDTPFGHTWRWTTEAGGMVEFHRVVAAARADSRADDPAPRAIAARAAAPPWRALLAAHEAAWADRWHECAVEIAGDPGAQQALRFAAYHLVSAANPADPAVSIGARAMTGDSYLGHVFWDTEIYLLPFYTLTWPEAARALLLYRHRTLPAARARAASLGYRGAMFAWESADTGAEATPPTILGADGVPVPVRTGTQEQHITADIAYAVWNHILATDDTDFLAEAGAELLAECARFWASRAEPAEDGSLHITGVIGPDEYHELVDDNAFTNAMAAHALRSAVAALALLHARRPAAHVALVARLSLADTEPAAWLRAAAALAILHDPATGLIEQFRGFFQLPHVDLKGTTGAEAAALVRGRTQQTQVSKQADVVALLALLPDAFPPETVRRSFATYEPLSTHESSLSAALHAVVAARLGHSAQALGHFRQAYALDMDGKPGSSAGGVHIAALGGVWQAAVLGFAGLSWQTGTLRLSPRLPEAWTRLAFALHWRGSVLRVRLDPANVALEIERGPGIDVDVCGVTVHVPVGPAVTVPLCF